MSRIERPTSLEDALALLAGPAARPVGGGVAVLLRARFGQPAAERYVALGRLPELTAIRLEPSSGALVVGAAATLADLAAEAAVREHAPLLAAAAGAAASPGIRSIATVAGNVVDAPADSDLVAAAIALGAELDVRAAGAVHRTAAPADASLGPGEIVVALRVAGPARTAWGLRRLQTQGAADRPAATVAVALEVADGVVAGLRAGATFVADRPLDLSSIGQLVAGVALAALAGGARAERLAEAVGGWLEAEVAAGLAVRDDLRASSAYRREVLGLLVARAVADAAARHAAGAASGR